MTLVYRLLSSIIHTIAIILSISFVISIPILFISPAGWFSAFIILSVILYSWFSFQFKRLVLKRQMEVKSSLKDWVRVNGLVAIFFSVLTVINVLYLVEHPQLLEEKLAEMKMEKLADTVKGLFIGMIFYATILLTHILWTFALMKKNQHYFK